MTSFHDHLAAARRLLATDPAAALAHANEAIASVPLDGPDLPGAIMVLADALAANAMHAEIVELVASCGDGLPRFVDLPYRLGRALQELGRHEEMLRAYEAAIAIGEEGTPAGTPGAGSYLPYHQLARFAESQGDLAGARQLYGKALSFGDHAPSRARLAELDPAAVKKKPLTLVVCIPGREFTGRFFDAWNEFMARCHAVGLNVVVSRRYDAVVYYARNKVLGGDVRRGAKQAPWGGELDYDFMLWIDSDVIFRFEDFQALLRHNVDLVAGLYLMADNARFSAVRTMNEEMFKKQGEFEFLTPAKTAKLSGLVPVDYCGFGFVLARRGVFEKVEYPWFRPIYMEIGECSDFTAEDVGFCMLAKKAGIQMHVDPTVVVGHEKMVVLQPPARPG